MNKLYIYCGKQREELSNTNGHDLRILRLLDNSNSISIVNTIQDLKGIDGRIIIDMPGVGIRKYILICIHARKFLRYMFMQDSNVRYNATKLVFIFRSKNFELISFRYLLNILRSIVREAFFYLVLKRIGFVCEADALPISKSFVAPNGISTKGVFLRPSDSIGRLVFWGNLDYEPNMISLLSYCKANFDFFALHKINVFGKVSKKFANAIKVYDVKECLILHGEFSTLDAILYSNDIFLNCIEFGSGVKNKTIEAGALGIFQMVTKHSIRGANVSPGSYVTIKINEGNLEIKYREAFQHLVSERLGSSLKTYSWSDTVIEYFKGFE